MVAPAMAFFGVAMRRRSVADKAEPSVGDGVCVGAGPWRGLRRRATAPQKQDRRANAMPPFASGSRTWAICPFCVLGLKAQVSASTSVKGK
ncbi:DUF2946 family protein [Streptomyces sp. NPDC050400]|uniref:DUF2946 family protein n=1 Tax=Streptomyces sp. NPDC050400 TaxID=3365610 RepID=UPI00379F0483